MKKYFVFPQTFNNVETTVIVDVPIEYRTVKGIFFFGNGVKNTTVSLVVDGKEILPPNTDSSLIEFTGSIKRDDVVFPLNLSNKGEKYNFKITPGTGSTTGNFNFYFEVE